MIITITDFIFQGKCCYIIHKDQCIKMKAYNQFGYASLRPPKMRF